MKRIAVCTLALAWLVGIGISPARAEDLGLPDGSTWQFDGEAFSNGQMRVTTDVHNVGISCEGGLQRLGPVTALTFVPSFAARAVVVDATHMTLCVESNGAVLVAHVSSSKPLKPPEQNSLGLLIEALAQDMSHATFEPEGMQVFASSTALALSPLTGDWALVPDLAGYTNTAPVLMLTWPLNTNTFVKLRRSDAPQRCGDAGYKAEPQVPWAPAPRFLPYDSVRLDSTVACLDTASGHLVLVKPTLGANQEGTSQVHALLTQLAIALPEAAAPSAESSSSTSDRPYVAPTWHAGASNSAAGSAEPSESYDVSNTTYLELLFTQVTPELFPKVVGGSVRLTAFEVTEDIDVFGLSYDYNLEIGFQEASNIPFDANVGIGFVLSLGPVVIGPLLGLGFDTLGAGADASFRFPFAVYWDFEARARVTLEPIIVEASVLRLGRGDLIGDAGAVPNETRFTLRLIFAELLRGHNVGVGVQAINYGSAKSLSGILSCGL